MVYFGSFIILLILICVFLGNVDIWMVVCVG